LDNDDLQIGTYTTDAPIPIGDTLELWDVASAPDLPGPHYLLFNINPDYVNPDYDITETQYVNNISGAITLEIEADYSGTAIVDDATFLQGTDIPIYGSAIGIDGQPRPNSELEVYIITGPIRRAISVTTDAAGDYTTTFEPLPNEGGHYTLGAAFPDINATAMQDEFDILGVEINSGEELIWELLVDETMNGAISVKNLSNTPFTNVSIEALSLPSGASLTFGTIPLLAGNETLDLSFTLTGTEASPNTNYQHIPLVVSTTENATQELTAYYYCQAQESYLRSEISSINRTVSPTESNILEFRIFNDGLGATGDITVDLPPADFMSLVTLPVMPSVEPAAIQQLFR